MRRRLDAISDCTFAEEGGRSRRAGEADQGAGQRGQVRQAEEGGAEEQEGRGQGEEVRMVELYCFARAVIM